MKKSHFWRSIAAALSAVIISSSVLVGCAGGGADSGQLSNPFSPISGQNGTGTTNVPAATGVDAQLKVTQGAWNNVQWTPYTHMYVTLEIPAGWTVEVQDLYQGGQTGSGTMVTVKSESDGVAFSYMDFATFYSGLVKEPTVESFYRDAIVGATNGKITNWQTTGLTQTEAQRQFVSSQSNILDARVLTADTTFEGKPKEGIYSGAIDGTLAYSGMYTIVSAITMETPKGTLANWESTLIHILSSIKWTDACLSRYQQSVLNSSGTSSNGSDSIMEAWDNRNKSEEIMSQKRSDATLGQERVYDTYTNDIYIASSGFSEKYSSMGGQRYQPITDDMYTQGYVGSINF